MIYLDNAATTELSKNAYDVIVERMIDFGNPSSLYSLARKNKKAIESARKIIADCLCCEPNEIYFTSGGSESDNWSVKNCLYNNCKRILVSAFEHHAIIHSAEQMRELNIDVDYLNITNDGMLDFKDLESKLTDEPTFVSVMMINNELGTIQDIKAISDFVHKKNPKNIVHTDAVQAVGHIRISVDELGVDLLSASAHKFGGPKGIGFLFARNGVMLKPLISGGSQESKMRAGTENVPYICAMSVALKESCDSLDRYSINMKAFSHCFLNILEQTKTEFRLNCVNSPRSEAIMSITFPGIDSEGLLNILDMKGICVSAGSACNSKDKEPSHVLKAIGLSDEYSGSTIRISFGVNNTTDEVETAARIVSSTVNQLKENL